MECNVCLNEWNSDSCIPRSLPCGHSFCEDCLCKLYQASQCKIKCPTCLNDHKVSIEPEKTKYDTSTLTATIADQFSKNFALIALADSQNRETSLQQLKNGLPKTARNNYGGKHTSVLMPYSSLGALMTNNNNSGSGRNSGDARSRTPTRASQLNKSGDQLANFGPRLRIESDDMCFRATHGQNQTYAQEEFKSSPSQQQVHENYQMELLSAKNKSKKNSDKIQRDESAADLSSNESQISENEEISSQNDINDLDFQNLPPPSNLKLGQKCEEHGLLIHSYHVRKRVLLCTMCVQETGWTGQDVKLFPQAVQAIKERIGAAHDLNKLRKMQVSSMMAKLMDQRVQNRKIVTRKVNDHCEALKRQVEAYENLMRNRMQIAFEEQDTVTDNLEKKVEEMLDTLSNNELSLHALALHDDQLLVYMTNTVDDVYKRMIDFQPTDIDLSKAQIHLAIDQTTSDKLSDVLETTCQISHEPLKNDFRQPVSATEIMKSDLSWLCPRCDHLHSADDCTFLCETCLAFKPVAFYEGLSASIDSPQSLIDIAAIEKRREMERCLLINADKINLTELKKTQQLQQQQSSQSSYQTSTFSGNTPSYTNSSSGSQQKPPFQWYFVSLKWFHRWKCFVLNETSQCEEGVYQVEVDSRIGVMPPGPISNKMDLCEPSGKLKDNLRINVHYKAVSWPVWLILATTYGATWVISKESIDISSPSVSAGPNSLVEAATFLNYNTPNQPLNSNIQLSVILLKDLRRMAKQLLLKGKVTPRPPIMANSQSCFTLGSSQELQNLKKYQNANSSTIEHLLAKEIDLSLWDI